jgi:hypothetical protein
MLRRLLLLSLVFSATLFGTWLLFFITIELFPGLLERLPLAGIRYYSLKQRYVTDPELASFVRTRNGVGTYVDQSGGAEHADFDSVHPSGR